MNRWQLVHIVHTKVKCDRVHTPLCCRYKLTDHAPDGLWVDSLAALNLQESNFEIRADKFAGLILGALNAGAPLLGISCRTALEAVCACHVHSALRWGFRKTAFICCTSWPAPCCMAERGGLVRVSFTAERISMVKPWL